jgi:aminopeptidase N
MWVHEGFTMYSEPLFIEYHYGKKAADEYVQGIRNNIENDKPVIGPYGVNQEGSGDMYNKGANMLHTIRQIINDDTLFRKILRGLNKDFYHSTVNSKDVEEYISKKSGKDFSKVFDQYLRTIKIPELQYKVSGNKVLYKWMNTVNGFTMPVKLANTTTWLQPTDKWKTITVTADMKKTGLLADKNFYVTVKKVK